MDLWWVLLFLFLIFLILSPNRILKPSDRYIHFNFTECLPVTDLLNLHLDLFGQDDTTAEVSRICIGHSFTVQCPSNTIISIHNTSYDEQQSVVSRYLDYSITYFRVTGFVFHTLIWRKQ